ncbi:MAG TPA: hypothetical protein VGC92_04250 [Phenylobacterium sp.]|jgi:hypothetical protein
MARQPRFRSRRTLAPQPAPPGIYASTYDPQLGAAICRRVAAGESLRAICADPAMPTGKTVWNWARAHEEFRLMKAHALSVARARSLAAQRARDAARFAKMQAGPRVAWNAGLDGYDEEIAQAICERLAMGESLTSICRDWRMPSIGTVYNWMRRHPGFVETVRLMKVGLADTLAEMACERLVQPERERDFEPLIRRTVKATERAARRVSLKRYASPEGPAELIVHLEDAAGERVIYRGRRPD